MIITDVSVKNTDVFQKMIGKSFDKYRCDPFVFTPSVYGIVGIYISGEAYKITSLHQHVERFYSNEDVAIMSVDSASDKEIVTMMDDGELIDTPIKDTIVSIDLINDREIVYHEEEQRIFISTKGIIFHLKSGNEVSFEIDTWFSEMITIKRGYELIKQFTPLEDFAEEWEDCEGYTPECSREIITIR